MRASFFERWFRPFEVKPAAGQGFFTGYYEPVVDGSRSPRPGSRCRSIACPTISSRSTPIKPPPGLDAGFRFARRTADGPAPYPDRGAIEAGVARGRGLELV